MNRDPYVVLTGARRSAHLLYVASFLRHLLSQHETVLMAWPEADHVPGGLELLPDSERLVLRREGDAFACPDERDLVYVAVGAPGLRPWARLRRANLYRHIRVVVTDEGLGSYGGWRTRRAAWSREGVSEPWRTVRTTAVVTGARVLTGDRWALYEQIAGADDSPEWRLAPDVASEFLRHTRRDPERVDNRVVLIGQPWPELGVLSPRQHLSYVDRVAAMVADAGHDFAVQAHPSEPRSRYGDMRLDGSVTAEIDPQVVQALAVVGGPSTALLNLAALHGVPVLRNGVPDRPDLDVELGPHQRSLLEQFTGPHLDELQLAERLRDLPRPGAGTSPAAVSG
ncbi:hypothetical protein ACMYYO_11415 [Dermacoccaceae bacterium W4C1]